METISIEKFNADYSNLSNISSSSSPSPDSSPLTYAEHYPLYLRVFMLGVHPPLVAFGLFSNALVLCLMPRRAVDISTSAKLFYMVIAAADTVNLLNSWVVWTIMDETMRVLTNNHVFLSIASSSNAACKVIYSIWCFTLCISAYTLLALSLQRTLITLLPLRTPMLIRVRVALLLIGVLTLPAVLLVIPPIAFLVGLQDRPGLKPLNSTLCDRLQDLPFTRPYTVVADLVTYVVPPFANLALVLVTGARLVLLARRFQQLTSSLHKRVRATATTVRFTIGASHQRKRQRRDEHQLRGQGEEQEVTGENGADCEVGGCGGDKKRTSSDGNSVSIIELNDDSGSSGDRIGAQDRFIQLNINRASAETLQISSNTVNERPQSEPKTICKGTNKLSLSENGAGMSADSDAIVGTLNNGIDLSQTSLHDVPTPGRNENAIVTASQRARAQSEFSITPGRATRVESSVSDSVMPSVTQRLHSSLRLQSSSPLKSALKKELRILQGADPLTPMSQSPPLPSESDTTPHIDTEPSTVRRRVSFAPDVVEGHSLRNEAAASSGAGHNGTVCESGAVVPPGSPFRSGRDRARRQSMLRSREVGATAVMLCLATINVLVFVPVAVIDILDSYRSTDSTEDAVKRWHVYMLLEENVCIALSLNCVVYLLRIPPFRAEFLRLGRLLCRPACALLRFCCWGLYHRTKKNSLKEEKVHIELQSSSESKQKL